jgi:hypothetical protein
VNLPGVLAIAIVVYAVAWIALGVGVLLIRTGNRTAWRIRTWLINKRIEQFQHTPLKHLLRLWLSGRFVRTSVTFVIVIILPAVLLFFLLGLLLITPLLAIYQGLVVGFFIAHFDRRHMLWAMAVAPFELGYWALSGALGVSATAGVFFNHLSLTSSLMRTAEVLASGYWIPLVICILVNGFAEVAGPIYWNLSGPVSLETLSKGAPVRDS